jgi:hypothetical protein
MKQQDLYDDGLVRLDGDGITIRRYYFPLATSKRIAYEQLKSVEDRPIGMLTGKGRLWGSGDLVHWLPLDLRRPRKDRALILDVGSRVKPTITPDDPDRVLKLLRQQTKGLSGRSPGAAWRQLRSRIRRS